MTRPLSKVYVAQTLDIRVLFQQMQTNVCTVRVNKNIVAPLRGQNFLYVDNISRRLVTSPEISSLQTLRATI